MTLRTQIEKLNFSLSADSWVAVFGRKWGENAKMTWKMCQIGSWWGGWPEGGKETHIRVTVIVEKLRNIKNLL